MNTCKPSTEQDKEEKVAEFIPTVNTPRKRTQYLSSSTHLHDFQLPVWGSAKLVQCAETNPMIENKSTPVFKHCLEAKQCKRVSSSRAVDKGLEVVREKRVKRREGLFSFSFPFSLRKEEIEEDFIRVTGMMPQKKMKVNKTFKSAEEKHKYLEHQKYVKQCFPGSWLSGIYHV